MISSEDIKKNISKNITKYREDAGFSQRELAQQLGITPSRISNWEQGANCPTIDILFEVCRALHVSINDIYGVYPDSEMMLSYSEQQHIQKYRNLDDHGRETVDLILERETIRSKELQKKEARIRELNKGQQSDQ
ncbi:MAG: helix-turn-helix transcriptional regulator [Lachnospiraceae bacterium]